MPITPGLVRQAAAIPVKGERVCLITSRSGKRWVIPKGCLEPGKTSGEIALQEAWEEAGLVGVLQPEPVGSYVYEKAGLTCHVTVFLMQVTEVARQWPEEEVRERVWLTFAQALQRVEEPALRELIRGATLSKVG
ncbi:MAG TPA: NUDIX hydrolase [Gemmataceae bacterium]|jgi:8-oxo-dGTP pyrophosphatase MutT (NUDIX family)|nr:NUDIX hydrolase [Gemmataceae bacterium]